MIDRGDVAVAQPRGDAGLADEALAGNLAVEVLGADDLQRHVAAKIGVEGLVGHAHGSASQFPERAVLAPEHLVMLEGFRLVGQRRQDLGTGPGQRPVVRRSGIGGGQSRGPGGK